MCLFGVLLSVGGSTTADDSTLAVVFWVIAIQSERCFKWLWFFDNDILWIQVLVLLITQCTLAGSGKECPTYLAMKLSVIRYSVILLVRYFVSTGFINNRVIAGYNFSVIGISMHCKISSLYSLNHEVCKNAGYEHQTNLQFLVVCSNLDAPTKGTVILG